MPRVTVHNAPQSLLWSAEVLLAQGIYQNDCIPHSDVEKVSTVNACTVGEIRPENVLTYHQDDQYFQIEEDQSIVSTETVTVVSDSPIPQEEPELCCVAEPLRVPNMEVEVAHLFAHSRTMPPCPPVEATSVKPLRFWYNRLVADTKMLQASNMVASCVLPAFPSSSSSCDDDVDMGELAQWTVAAFQWWSKLSACMTTNGLGCNLPTEWRWNPYADTLVRRFSTNNTTTVVHVKPAVANQPCARNPPPPPPAYAAMFAHRRASASSVDAERLCQEYLRGWWLSATTWAASAVLVEANQWICPPPTTAATTEAWFDACATWCSYVSAGMRAQKSKRRNHA